MHTSILDINITRLKINIGSLTCVTCIKFDNEKNWKGQKYQGGQGRWEKVKFVELTSNFRERLLDVLEEGWKWEIKKKECHRERGWK